MASSFFDSVHELKTKFPVIEETLVFMYKFIFLAFSLDKDRDDCYVSLIHYSMSFNLSLFHNYDSITVTGHFSPSHCSLPTTLEMGKL